MQADDARADACDEPLELVDFEQRHAELRMHAGRADVVVMTAAVAGVDADEHVAAAEQLAPLAQRMQVVERQLHALLQAPTRIPRAAQNSA